MKLELTEEEIREIQTLLYVEAEVSYNENPMPERTKVVIRIYQKILAQTQVRSEDIKNIEDDWVAEEVIG